MDAPLISIRALPEDQCEFSIAEHPVVEKFRSEYVSLSEVGYTVVFPTSELADVQKLLLDAGFVVVNKDKQDQDSDEETNDDNNDDTPLQYDPYVEARRLVAEKISCFITGPAGSGKSSLMWTIAQDVALVQHRTMGIVATTGMAADELCAAMPLNIRSKFEDVGEVPTVQTFHSYFGIPWDVQNKIGVDSLVVLADKWRRAIEKRPTVRSNWDKDVFIVDEISMMEAELFSLWQRVANDMGKRMQLVLVGDFCQLPPVDTTRTDLAEGERTRSTKFAFESEYWNDLIGDNVCSLDRNYRLKDPTWVNTMAALRMGQLTEEQRNSIAKMNSAEKQLTNDHVWVVPKNAMALEHNKECASRLIAEGAEWRSYQRQIVLVSLDRQGGERQTITSTYQDYEMAVKIIDKTVKEHGGHDEHKLMVGAKVVLTMNIDPKAHLVNGARGVITGITDSSVTIDFHMGGVRRIGWRTIDAVQKMGKATYTAKVKVMPVVLGFAITINKSQGSTLDDVYVKLTTKDDHGNAKLEVFQPSMVYVALTRAQGDVIVDGFELCTDVHLGPHESVVAFYSNTRQPRAFQQYRTRGVPTARINPFTDPYVLKEPPLAVTVWRDRVLKELEYEHELNQLEKKIQKKRRQIEIAKRRQSSLSVNESSLAGTTSPGLPSPRVLSPASIRSNTSTPLSAFLSSPTITTSDLC